MPDMAGTHSNRTQRTKREKRRANPQIDRMGKNVRRFSIRLPSTDPKGGGRIFRRSSEVKKKKGKKRKKKGNIQASTSKHKRKAKKPSKTTHTSRKRKKREGRKNRSGKIKKGRGIAPNHSKRGYIFCSYGGARRGHFWGRLVYSSVQGGGQLRTCKGWDSSMIAYERLECGTVEVWRGAVQQETTAGGAGSKKDKVNDQRGRRNGKKRAGQRQDALGLRRDFSTFGEK